MSAILITGMSGTGKSTLLVELSRRGYQTIDTDYNGWCIPSGDGPELVWDEPRIQAMLAQHEDDEQAIVISGCVSNQGSFYDQFSSIVLLSAPIYVILDRILTRTTNDYGKTPEQAARILDDVENVEPLLRRSANIELDATTPVEELADAIEALIASVG